MSGNHNRRHQGPPPAHGGSIGNGYYRMNGNGNNNAQNNIQNPNNQPYGLSYRGNSHRGRGGYSNRGGMGSGYSGRGGNYNHQSYQSRYNNYNNPGYYYNSNNQANYFSNQNPSHHSQHQSQHSQQQFPNTANSNSKVSNNNNSIESVKIEKEPQPTISTKSNPNTSKIGKPEQPVIKNSQLFSSRRGDTSNSASSNIKTMTRHPKPSSKDHSMISHPVNTSTFKTANENEPFKRKPVDFSSLQPMKKKKKSETQSPIERKESGQHKDENIEKESQEDRRNRKVDSRADSVAPKTEKVKSDEEFIDAKIDNYIEKNSKVSSSTNTLHFDEDEPIAVKKRSRSTPSTENINKIPDSEEDTDIEDSIPVPSKKTRRLHRLLTSADSDNDNEPDEAKNKPNFGNSKQQEKKNSSRSRSPKPRKTSSRVGRDASGRTLLQRMCAKGSYEEVKKLIESQSSNPKFNINDADFAGTTSLHEAALEGHLQITKLLLDNGADIDIQSGQMDKDTPLIDAVSNLHYDVIKLLLKRGANPAVLNAQNQNALDVLETTLQDYDEDDDEDEEAIETGKKIQKLLLKYMKTFENDVSASTQNESKLDDDKTSDINEEVVLLKNAGYDLLQKKIRENDVTYVLSYVSNNSSSEIPPESLLLASKLGFPDIASLLIAFGADIDHTDKNGWTPLIHAAKKGHLEMTKLLLSNQANVKSRDKNGLTVIDVLRNKKSFDENNEIFKLIRDKLEDLASSRDGDEIDDESQSQSSDFEDQNDESFHEPTYQKKKLNRRKKLVESESESESEAGEQQEEEKIVAEQAKEEQINQKPKTSQSHIPTSEETNNTADTRSLEPAGVPELAIKSENDDGKHSPKADTFSPSPVPTPQTEIHSHRKVSSSRLRKQESEEKHEATPTPEEIEAQKLKEYEAQKAREALEQQRLERKRLKQQEIAKRIDAFEKQREEESKAIERAELERKRKEEEEKSQILKAEEESKKRQEMQFEIEKKKLIRSFYPHVLRNYHFGVPMSKSEIRKYLPLYVFKMNENDREEYLIDIQLNLVLNVEHLYLKYPQLQRDHVVKDEFKACIWNNLWPILGSFQDPTISSSVETLQQVYRTEGEKFKSLVIHFVKLSDFQKLLKLEELHDIAECVTASGLCRTMLTENFQPIMDLRNSTLTPTPAPTPTPEVFQDGDNISQHSSPSFTHAIPSVNDDGSADALTNWRFNNRLTRARALINTSLW